MSARAFLSAGRLAEPKFCRHISIGWIFDFLIECR
jgi:hypothetical protein